MKLYTYYRSQASFRVRTALNLKGIARAFTYRVETLSEAARLLGSGSAVRRVVVARRAVEAICFCCSR
jgi:hypothetical protein